MRVLVCGGRHFNDGDFVHNALCRLDSARGPFTVILHGCCTGADHEAEIWAMAANVKIVGMRAEWQKHGRAAGPIRNRRLLDAGVDLVIAFPGGRGTADVVREARRRGIEVMLCWPYGPPAFHQPGCTLHTGGVFCDCAASDAGDTEWTMVR